MTTMAPRVDAAGRVLPLTRAGVWILFVLAAANGLFLYLAPARAETDYAWSIKPPVNAAFIGAGFLAGTLATGLVLFATRRWRSFSMLPPALWVLAATLALATAIHHDRFKWDYPPTWGWALVYVAVPCAIPFLVARQRRSAEPPPAADPRLRAVRWLSAVTGAVLVLGALALYLAPVGLGQHWPWALTPLLGRAVAAWYALIGTILLVQAGLMRRAAEGLIGYATIAAWSVLLLGLPLLHPDDFDTSGAAFWIWFGVLGALLCICAVALADAVGDAREAGGL
jgi:hypothetical protein